MSGLMAPWPVRVAKALDRDENSRVVVENLDQVIRWITGRPSDTTTALDLETSKLGLEPGMARTRALVIINRMMLTRPDPWQALGVRRGTDPDEARVRYKRLMQVFHPDRGFADPDWLSDCTARLHWAHDAIRKSPAARGGFTTGFGKRTRVSKPPPWSSATANGARAPKPQQPRSQTPPQHSAGGVEVDVPQETVRTVAQEPKSAPSAAEGVGVSSGVWQFPASSQPGSDGHREDEQYVQRQARRTTESVAAPQDGGFAQTHDVMAEDLAADDGGSDYDSVFESAIELERPDETLPSSEEATTDAAAVDPFEQASPLAYEINPGIDEDDQIAARIKLKSRADTEPARVSYDEEVDDDQQQINERIAKARQQQIARDEANARQEQERLLEMHRQQQAQKEAAQAKVDARIQKEHERSLKLEESRREKERRKQLKMERQLERKREKEQRKKEKIELKHRELQQQRLEAEAAEKKLKQERQRLRAEAKHRAELEVEKRRLRELDELQRKEAEAFEAQKAREAERRRRHLNAEGSRLSSVSDRSPADHTSVTETTIPPWQEHLPGLTPTKSDDTTNNAISGNTIETLHTSDTDFSAARSRHAKVDSSPESGVSRISNVEHINTAKDRLRVVADSGVDSRTGLEEDPRSKRRGGRDKDFDEDIFKPDAKVRNRDDGDDLSDSEASEAALEASMAREQTQHAANDDSARRPYALSPSRGVIAAACIVGLICLGVLTVAIQKLMEPGAGPGLAQSEQRGTADSTVSPDPNSVVNAAQESSPSDLAVVAENESAPVESEPAAIIDDNPTVSADETSTTQPQDSGNRIVINTGHATDQTPPSSVGRSTDESNSDASATSEVTTETITVEAAGIATSDVARSGTEPKQLDVVVNANPETATSAADAPVSSTDSQALPTTVESIAEPAIDRTPTTVAKSAIANATNDASAGDAAGSSLQTIQSEVRGVNISTDPVANVQHIVEELGRRYTEGDVDGLTALFAQDATMNELTGVAAIHDFHKELFETTSARRAIIDVGQVDADGIDYSTRGRFSKVLRFNDGTSRLSDSTIILRVGRDGDRFVITALSY